MKIYRTSKECSEALFQHYKKDEKGCYIIEIGVPALEKLFSPFDPSPLHEREIDSVVMSMILGQFIVFPLNAHIELHLVLPKNLKRKKLDSQIEAAIRHHFEYDLLDSELHLKRRIQKGLRTFRYAGMVFVSLFALSYVLGNLETDSVILHLLAEGFAVGAWVSLWHPIETLLYDWLPLREDKKKFSRLMDMKVRIRYA